MMASLNIGFCTGSSLWMLIWCFMQISKTLRWVWWTQNLSASAFDILQNHYFLLRNARCPTDQQVFITKFGFLSQKKFSELGGKSQRCLGVAPDLSPHYRRRLKIHRYFQQSNRPPFMKHQSCFQRNYDFEENYAFLALIGAFVVMMQTNPSSRKQGNSLRFLPTTVLQGHNICSTCWRAPLGPFDAQKLFLIRSEQPDSKAGDPGSLSQGLNTGVMLYHLDCLRENQVNWAKNASLLDFLCSFFLYVYMLVAVFAVFVYCLCLLVCCSCNT